jgi:hypothetical protein
MRTAHQFRRRKGAVRSGGMGVQIVVQTHLLHSIPPSRHMTRKPFRGGDAKRKPDVRLARYEA